MGKPSKFEQMVDGSWEARLSSAIVETAFRDYMMGLMCACDSSCTPANMSVFLACSYVKECEEFFNSNWCKELTDLDCPALAKMVKKAVKPYVKMLRKTRPDGKEPGTFECPNCGGTVSVKWANEPAGLLYSSCNSCMFHSLYNIPLKEVKERRAAK